LELVGFINIEAIAPDRFVKVFLAILSGGERWALTGKRGRVDIGCDNLVRAKIDDIDMISWPGI